MSLASAKAGSSPLDSELLHLLQMGSSHPSHTSRSCSSCPRWQRRSSSGFCAEKRRKAKAGRCFPIALSLPLFYLLCWIYPGSRRMCNSYIIAGSGALDHETGTQNAITYALLFIKVLGAAKDLTPRRKHVAGPHQAPVAKAFMVLEAMSCVRYLVVPVQESLQAQDGRCFIHGSVQEEQLLPVCALDQRAHPVNVPLSFGRNLFHTGVDTTTDEAHQRFHLVALASVIERLQRPAVQGAPCNRSLAAALLRDCRVVDAEESIRGIASQCAGGNRAQVASVLRV